MLRGIARAWFVVAALSAVSEVRAAGPTIEVVIGEKADALERLAADEAAALLKKLYDAEVRIANTVSPGAGDLVLIGTPSSNPAFKELKLDLPAVVQDDFAVKSSKQDGRTVTAVLGAKPRGALSATYELGWRLGVRYFPFGDLYPAAPPKLAEAALDAALRPDERRPLVWNPTFASPIDLAAWSADDLRRYVRQLSKLRYKKIVLDGSAAKLGGPETGLPIAITSDTMGRAAFQGAKAFDNADLAKSPAGAPRAAAAKKLIAALREEAARHGIEVADAEASAPVFAPVDMLGAVQADFYLAAHSRLEVDERFSIRTIFEEMLAPVCGAEVGGRVERAFAEYERAMVILNRHDEGLGTLGPKMLLQHYEINEPVPGSWNHIRTGYMNAMNEMYRANTRAREGGRTFTLYYARRFEFVVEYLNACESVRRAGLAKRKGDKEAQIVELEKAIDSVTAACNAIAAVARSPSDRGLIAVMNEHGYRPLVKLLEEADAQ